MSIPKIIGIETEYRFDVDGYNYLEEAELCKELIRLTGLSFELKLKNPIINYDSHSELNLKLKRDGFTGYFLPNGMRVYLENDFIPEVSTPECKTAKDTVIYDKAAEKILNAVIESLSSKVGKKIKIFKNNSDGFGNSYACHENYSLTPKTFLKLIDYTKSNLNLIQAVWITFVVSRQIMVGAGKIGVENSNRQDNIYQISQRADFFETLLSIATTRNRPLINTRDVPYANPSKYRRFHVIIGDSNMSELSDYLKTGTAAIVLSMLEDNYVFYYNNHTSPIMMLPVLSKPLKALKQISRDLSYKLSVDLNNNSSDTAIGIQEKFCDVANEWYKVYKDNYDANTDIENVLKLWRQTLDLLKTDPDSLNDRLDYRIKLSLFESYLKKYKSSWDKVLTTMVKTKGPKGEILEVPILERLKNIDLSYHDISPRGIYNQLVSKGKIKRILTDDEIDSALFTPPKDTRAYIRGKSLSKFSSEIENCNWQYIYIKDKEDSKLKIDLDDLLSGTEDDSAYLISKANNIYELYDLIKIYRNKPQ